jgi:hypothetical protein
MRSGIHAFPEERDFRVNPPIRRNSVPAWSAAGSELPSARRYQGAFGMSTTPKASLEDSLMDLHNSVHRLIKVIQEHAGSLDRGSEVLDKLPMLDFYNDDLLRNIENMRFRE